MRIEAEFLKLPIPFGVRIAETLDADAAGQATFRPLLGRDLERGMQARWSC